MMCTSHEKNEVELRIVILIEEMVVFIFVQALENNNGSYLIRENSLELDRKKWIVESFERETLTRKIPLG